MLVSLVGKAISKGNERPLMELSNGNGRINWNVKFDMTLCNHHERVDPVRYVVAGKHLHVCLVSYVWI